jgi:hypothetical protein
LKCKNAPRTSWIISINSASVGFCPRERMTVPSSLVVMVPKIWKEQMERNQSGIHKTCICGVTTWSSK